MFDAFRDESVKPFISFRHFLNICQLVFKFKLEGSRKDFCDICNHIRTRIEMYKKINDLKKHYTGLLEFHLLQKRNQKALVRSYKEVVEPYSDDEL